MNRLTVNNLSLKRLAKALLLVIVCGVIAGISGVLTILLMFWMTHQSFALDSHQKHGISHQSASRLGGVAVAFCALFMYWQFVGLEFQLERVGGTLFSSPVSYALLVGLIGFFDDALGHLSAKARLVLTAAVFAAFFLINPSLIPTAIGIPLLDTLIEVKILAFGLCLFGSLGMLNATNMADGANGLMPLVFMAAFYGFFTITGELIYFTLTMGLMVFSLFNVLSGKLFLGDAGSYGLGALAALAAVKIIAETGAEVWFFLCIASYPVIDFFVSISRRKLAGKSALSADSDHMHNRLYHYLRGFVSSPLVANSISGLTISIGTTGVSIVLLGYWNTNSNYWVVLFLALIAVYLIAYWLLPSNETKAVD